MGALHYAAAAWTEVRAGVGSGRADTAHTSGVAESSVYAVLNRLTNAGSARYPPENVQRRRPVLRVEIHD